MDIKIFAAFCYGGGKTLAQLAQSGGGCPILGNIAGQVGQDCEQAGQVEDVLQMAAGALKQMTFSKFLQPKVFPGSVECLCKGMSSARAPSGIPGPPGCHRRVLAVTVPPLTLGQSQLGLSQVWCVAIEEGAAIVHRVVPTAQLQEQVVTETWLCQKTLGRENAAITPLQCDSFIIWK